MAIPPSKTTIQPTRFANKFPPLPIIESMSQDDQLEMAKWWNDVQLVLTGQFNQVAVKIDTKADKG
jgi:hypothetical protein